MSYELSSFGVNMPGCRYNVRPCVASEPGAEKIISSQPGLLLTEKHELRNLFILPVDAEFVVIEAVQ